MRNWVIVAFLILFVLHQDCWLWDSRTLVWGFVPVGLAYHAGFSIASALLWAFTVRFAWPKDLEESVLRDRSARAEGESHP